MIKIYIESVNLINNTSIFVFFERYNTKNLNI